MVIFNSYVKLPEGTSVGYCMIFGRLSFNIIPKLWDLFARFSHILATLVRNIFASNRNTETYTSMAFASSTLACSPSCQERTKDVHMLRVTKERCICLTGGPKVTWIVYGYLFNPSEHGKAEPANILGPGIILNHWHLLNMYWYYWISISVCKTHTICLLNIYIKDLLRSIWRDAHLILIQQLCISPQTK